MPIDSSQRGRELFELSEVYHFYGPNVHVIRHPYLATLLARLSAKETKQPDINRLIQTLYTALMQTVIACEFPRADMRVETRMAGHTPDATLEVSGIDPATEVVCVDIARAGMVPSQICFDMLLDLLNPDGVRQDHLVMARTADPGGRVNGADIHGSKIGGPIADKVVLFPDPMGATGTSLCRALSTYKDHDVQLVGRPRMVVTLNLIITSEFIRRVHRDHPEVIIYALRLDRGLSPPDVLRADPGACWDEECGLNEHDYIVPGAGGLGEIINNAFV